MDDEVLRHIEEAFELLHYRSWKTGPKTGAAQQLQSLIGTYPAPLWSSEHHRVHAKTAATTWGERVDSLRRAVDLDHGNLRARCNLAHALVVTGKRVEAASLYLDLASIPSPPCNPREALHGLEQEAERTWNPPPVASDAPADSVILK